MFKYTTEGMTECGFPYGCYNYGHHKEGLGSNVGGTALVVLLILIAIALFWGFNSHERKADERRLADNLFNVNRSLGIVEKGVVDNEKEIARNGAILTGLTQDYSFRIGGLTCRTDANTSAISQLGHYTCYPAAVPFGVAPVAAGCGCNAARNAGTAEFLKEVNYVQDGDITIRERNACGNAFA